MGIGFIVDAPGTTNKNIKIRICLGKGLHHYFAVGMSIRQVLMSKMLPIRKPVVEMICNAIGHG
jgi:hypothetical protein